MKTKKTAMVLASFAADSLALGAHWIYDTAVIDNDFGRVETLRKPKETSFHPTKDLGDFTHYGDQTLLLLESIVESNGFDFNDFARNWKAFFDGYDGYLDHATKDTLKNFAKGKDPDLSGSTSTDLGGAARIAPLVYVYSDNQEKLVSAAKEQTSMTHNDPAVIESAAFFAGVARKVLQGLSPVAAIKELPPEGVLQKGILDGLESSRMETRKAIKNFGQMCDTGSALPSVVHLIAKYENNLKEALVENVMAGGDSAARGLLVGMVLGAHLGLDAIPQEWLQKLKKYQKITSLLQTFDQSA